MLSNFLDQMPDVDPLSLWNTELISNPISWTAIANSIQPKGVLSQFIDFEGEAGFFLIYFGLITLIAPLIWNGIARLQYYTNLVRKACFGSTILAVSVLALWIKGFSSYRDIIFRAVMKTQPSLVEMDNIVVDSLGYLFLAVGTVFVLGSTYRLGFFGTFLGDYFGVLQSSRVTAFPYSVVDNPMYVGSTLAYLGEAFLHHSPIGLLLTAWVWIVYQMAQMFEEPFTSYIYSQAEKLKQLELDKKTT